MIRAFIILPYGLLKQGVDVNEVEGYLNTLLTKPYEEDFKKITNKIKTRAFKKIWNEHGVDITNVIKSIQAEILAKVNENPDVFVMKVVNWDNEIPSMFWEKALELAQKTGMNEIDLSED